MPQYLLVAKDHPNQLERRMKVREKHIELGNRLVTEGKLIYGGAIIGDDGEMRGSMFVCNFENRKKLDDWLEIEPYITGDVWQNIEITEFRTGPSFQHLSL